MKPTHGWQQKLKQLISILLPVLITQVSLSAMSFFDTTMSGHASATDLAGVAIGANIWLPVFTAVTGMLLAVTPITAQLNGANCQAEIPFVIIQGIYLALVLAVVVILSGSLFVPKLLISMQLDEKVSEVASGFLKALALGVVPLFVSAVLRNFVDTLGYTRITMGIVLGTLPINILLNDLLIFGHWGFPKLGGAGAGYASALTYWCIALVSIWIVCKQEPFRSYSIFGRIYRPSLSAWQEQLAIGVPIGLAIFCETSIFGVVALLMGQYGTVTIAAHQASINFASLIYMLPLSIGMALTIVVGFEVGANRLGDARQYCQLAMGLGVILAVLCGAGLLLWKDQVAKLYTSESAVLELTKQFLLYAVFFQLSDAVAAPIQGALRGYKDVKITFFVALFSYWLVGLPTGYFLAQFAGFNAFGYWLGFIAGLAMGAVILFVRLIWLQRHPEKIKLLRADA